MFAHLQGPLSFQLKTPKSLLVQLLEDVPTSVSQPSCMLKGGFDDNMLQFF